MIEIHEMKSVEYEFLREMLYEAIYFPFENEKLPKSIVDEPALAKYIRDFGRRGDFAFVLVDENELVGAAWSRLFAESEKSYGFIDAETPEFSIAVREGYRNRGFGSGMMRELFGKLQAEGFEKISLSVDKLNPAVNLYLRFGFEVVAEEGTALTMLKKL
ncbi:MAG: GNAT family N-acetyltransferase [Blastocatellia bacterium]|nr:GNAT family N-acetyltransferase [Blastocatellia bacterium]